MRIKSSKTLVEEASKYIKNIDLNEAKEMIDKKTCTLLDIRDIREVYNEGAIAHSLHIPRGMLEFWVDEDSQYYKDGTFNIDKEIVIFCSAGQRSALAAKTLIDMGFKKVFCVKGGYRSMAASGIFPLQQIKRPKK